jgi:hypothetical protein
MSPLNVKRMLCYNTVMWIILNAVELTILFNYNVWG